ncbi:MFS transporter [Streptomyces oceani]|uniref:MFS transporter n=1 Tax=Streptomyces oceani TaxID=1075402 RepID=UPI000872801D|nr:MFS transporter [Streptomyces oceani]
MPGSPPPARPPRFALTGGTLVAVRHAPPPGADRTEALPPRPVAREPRRRAARTPRWLAPYRRLFAVPGARAFTLGNLLARLPMGMLSVAAVLMIAGQRGSYALAGAVTATGLAATAVVGPLTARLVDRHGQSRVILPATALAAGGSLALVLCVRTGAPDWTLFAAHAATATTPNTGGMSRARWAYLFPDDPAARHTANSFEQAADELCFMCGPVLAALLCTTLFPEAGTLVGAVLLVTGMTLFAAQRRTEPPPAPRSTGGTAGGTAGGRLRGRGRAPLRLRGMPPLLVTFCCTGMVFGSLEVVTLAYADGLGHASTGGAVVAVQAAGSAVAGLVFGTLRLTGAPVRRLVRCVCAMTGLLALPPLAASTGELAPLAVALLLAGMGTAPTMVTGMTLVQRITPTDRLNEGMTLAVTALLGGIAAGSAVGGSVAERLGEGAVGGYGLPVAAAALGTAVAAAGFRQELRVLRTRALRADGCGSLSS